MSGVAGAIVAALRRRAGKERLRIGVFYRRDPEALVAILNLGHDTIVAGDSFRALYRAARRIGVPKSHSFRLVEARFDALPFRPGSLDALVLLRGVPAGAGYESTVLALKAFLAPGGVLVFPHPVTDGRRGRLARLLRAPFFGTLPPQAREALCRGAMSAGLGEVGQLAPAGRGLVPWIVTFGASGRR
jgi:hypothetical protein